MICPCKSQLHNFTSRPPPLFIRISFRPPLRSTLPALFPVSPMLWLLLPPPAAAAAAATTVLLAATVTLATVISATVISCAGKKKEPKILDIADDQSICDSSTISKPSGAPSSNSSNGSDQSLKPRKDKTVDDISKRWKEGNQIFTEMDESDAEQDPKLIVPKTERSAKKPKDKKKLLFPPAKLVPPAAADKRPTLAALQPPSSDPESDTSAGTGPDKPMTTPAPDDGTYQCLGGLDDSKKKTTVRRVSRIVRPPAAHEAVPRGRTPMCQPSPAGTPAAPAKDQSTPHAARRVPPAAATVAKPAAPKAAAGPTVEDYDPAAKTAHTDVSLLADRVAPQEQTPVAPSPAPRAIKCAPMPAQPAAAPVIASAPGTPVRAAPRTPAAPPLVLPATSPGCRNMKTQEKTQADSPVRGKVVC